MKDDILSKDISNKNNSSELFFNSNPMNIKYLKDLTEDSYSFLLLDNTFCVFKSIDQILYLIYSNENNSILAYNLISNKKITEIKNAHNNNITNFRYYFDKKNFKDLIISISSQDNNLKLWNMQNFECILNLKDIDLKGDLNSACVLNDNNENYIITSNYGRFSLPIKVFDFNGNKIKEINNYNKKILFIDTFYDKKTSKNYIIAGTNIDVNSYDFNGGKIFKNYCENNNGEKGHSSIIILMMKDIIELIESCDDGNVRIWNFHSGELLKKINVCNTYLYGICLWNKQYLFVGCEDKEIKLINLENGKIINKLKGHSDSVLTIKKVIHPEYGECLLSQGNDKDQIKLWIIEN